MKIKILSDLHMEFWNDGDAIHSLNSPHIDTVLIIAGDLHVGKESMVALTKLRNCYRAIVYVPGNHEYYGNDFETLSREFSAFNSNNVHILNPGTVTIGNTHFIGATLWSDLAKGDIAAMDAARDNMNDFYMIKYRDRRLSTFQYRRLHYYDLEYLESTLPGYPAERTIVVTHHMPSYHCVHADYEGSPLNPAFTSDLDWLIEREKPRIWVHGHTHSSLDIIIGETSVICNPFGYRSGGLNQKFEPELMVEV